MNWSFAKNIMLILLIMLNIALLMLRVSKSSGRYTLDETSENNIRNILTTYDYHLYTMLPNKYYPQRTIKSEMRVLDSKSISKHFFKGARNVSRKNDGNKEIYYTDDTEYVEIYRNGKIKYYYTIPKTHEALKDGIITKKEAYELLTDFMGRVYKGDRIYQAVGFENVNNVYKYSYYNTFKNTLIFNDYIKVEVHPDHIAGEIWGLDITSSANVKKEILPVDEIIFNFIKTVPAINKDGNYITDIQLGYYAINDVALTNGEVTSYPYYKITLQYYGDYYVNAYDNTVFDNNLIKVGSN